MTETDEEITARIRASIEADMLTPEWQARHRQSLKDIRTGNFVDAFLPMWLPWNVRRVLTMLKNPVRYFKFIRAMRQ